MRVLFIENRFRTIFWRTMADLLRKDGHDVKFLVQNHSFSEDDKNDMVIPYPKTLKGETENSRNFPLIESDRNINYFEHKGTSHYDYYRTHIDNILSQFSPDIVFGESTAFHELLTIDICKEKDIPYLQPTTCRYPTGRFSFYQYDTLKTYGGSGEQMSDEESGALVKAITMRSAKPDYMVKRKTDVKVKFKRLKNLVSHTLAYYKGEHYNTPNPIIKHRIERAKYKIISEWDELARSRKGAEKGFSFRILYPMQMQPEANLDVWGRKYRDQLKTIRSIVENTPEDVAVVVKPNPKSKYELTSELLDYIRSESRVVPMEHAVKMDDVLPHVQLVVTATGTIAIECILSNIPVVTLVKTLNNNAPNCIFIDSFSDLPKYIAIIRERKFPLLDDNGKKAFINHLNATSFKGQPYDRYLTEANIRECYGAFRKIINQIS